MQWGGHLKNKKHIIITPILCWKKQPELNIYLGALNIEIYVINIKNIYKKFNI